MKGNPQRILSALDEHLTAPVELTLYGRAALQLGFDNAPEEMALTRDVDAVLWLGQAEELLEHTNFWEAVNAVNEELKDQELFISHFFSEDQVVLLPNWRENRRPVAGEWKSITLFRLSDTDLLLSKLMRDDPIDLRDARFIIEKTGLTRNDIENAVQRARIPDVEEIKEQFKAASSRLLDRWP